MVSCVDDAAWTETLFLYEVNHPCVVLMRINADVRTLLRAPLQYLVEDACLSAIGCDTMDRSIALTIIYPFAFNIRVGRVFADDENEGSTYRALVFYHVAISLLNIIH